MEAIGTLAGGIAHDFNNLLMGIQGRASLMLADADPAGPFFEHLKSIEDYVRSASQLTKQLLGFAQGGRYEVKVTDLNELVDRSAGLFGRTRREISIHRRYQDDLWKVEVDRGQIEQVLINLFVNAWQAMPRGGELYLETENAVLDDDAAQPYGVKVGRYARVAVTDTGVGMDEATKRRVFDPFFTTKATGRGSGLGLASAYGIVRNHGGMITADSEEGRGSTFAVYLPATDKPLPEDRQETEGASEGEGTILLVDDEEMILDVGRLMLERLGYDVLVSGSGAEAVETYRANAGRIRAVILDMVMPRISGGETFEQLRAIDPGVKVLLSSGYSIDGEARKILARGCDGFIQKPFGCADLSTKLKEILDRR
jgi:CheY-like chemotaxis protein